MCTDVTETKKTEHVVDDQDLVREGTRNGTSFTFQGSLFCFV